MKGRFYHPELDALRFFAFVLVFIHHSIPHTAAEYGPNVPALLARIAAAFSEGCGYSVDLFFGLSAYLITEIVLREHRQSGTINVKAFYIRRILRIWPLYLSVVLLGPPIAHWINPNENLSWPYLLGFLFFSGNLVCAAKGFPPSSFVPLWSVSIEEQFYLTWPLVLKRWAGKVHYVCLALLLLATTTRGIMFLYGAAPITVGLTTLARIDSIALGALLAFWLKGKVLNLPLVTRVMLFVSGLSCMVVVGWVGQGANPLWAFPLVALGCTSIIFGVLCPECEASGLMRPLTYLGRISYGLYVFHMAALHIADIPVSHGISQLAIKMGLGGLITVAMAALSYRYLETPFLRMKNRFSYVPPSDPAEGSLSYEVAARAKTAASS